MKWFLQRLRGIKLLPAGSPSTAPAQAPPPPLLAKPAAPLPPRIDLAQRLWGEGFLVPGAAAHLEELIQPLRLGRGSVVLDLSAGVGGLARMIARAPGAWVTGLDRDAEAAKIGMALSVAARLRRRAALRSFDPETVELKPSVFDAVMSRYLLHEVRAKERLLRVARTGLRAGGQLLITEYAVVDPAGCATWVAQGSRPVELWTSDQIVDCLTGLGFSVAGVSVITDVHRALVARGFRRLVAAVEHGTMPPALVPALAVDAAYWAAQIKALDAGALDVVRVHAVAEPPARPSKPAKPGIPGKPAPATKPAKPAMTATR